MPGAPGRALTAATAALALSGCGIEVVPAEHERQHARMPPAPLLRATSSSAPEAGACRDHGAHRGRHAAGACGRSPQRVVVVGRGDTLELGELTVRVLEQTVRRTLPATRARLVDPHYTFVLMRLDVVNKLARPARFGRAVDVGRQPQVMLRLAGRWYPEYQQAERKIRDGFGRQRRPIPAGELRSGRVVFGVPRTHARRLAHGSNALGVVGFGETGGSLRPGTLGLIRLGPER